MLPEGYGLVFIGLFSTVIANFYLVSRPQLSCSIYPLIPFSLCC